MTSTNASLVSPHHHIVYLVIPQMASAENHERQVLLASDDYADAEALGLSKLGSSHAELAEGIRIKRVLHLAIAFLSIVLAVSYLYDYVLGLSSKRSSSYDDSDVELEVTNEYGSTASTLDYPWLDDALLMEPYRETTIRISNSNKDLFGHHQCEYSWMIYNSGGSDDDMMGSMDGTSSANGILHSSSGSYDDYLVYTHKGGAGKIVVTVSEDCQGSYSRAQSQLLYVKYIRRELRSLIDEDREELLDAIQILYNTSTVDGIAMYGETYKSVHYFTAVHVDGAGNPVCDEFHAGAGYLNNHVYMGNYFEQALQAVNPK